MKQIFAQYFINYQLLFISYSEPYYELWCGQVGGFISIINPDTLDVIEGDIHHLEEARPLTRVTQLMTYDVDIMDDVYPQYVWSYVAPGEYSELWPLTYDIDIMDDVYPQYVWSYVAPGEYSELWPLTYDIDIMDDVNPQYVWSYVAPGKWDISLLLNCLFYKVYRLVDLRKPPLWPGQNPILLHWYEESWEKW